MKVHCQGLTVLVLSLTLLAPVTGSAGGYDWFQTLENTFADQGKEVGGIALYGDAVYVAARTVLVKYSADGRELWRRAPVTPFDSTVLRVAADAEGVYVAGSAQDENGYLHGLVQKFDHGGGLLWTNIDRDPEQGSEIWGLSVTDTGVYVSGYRYPEGATLRGLTKDGANLWESWLGVDSPTGGLEVSRGTIYVAANDRIFVYDLTGTRIADFGVPLNVGSLVLNASGLVIRDNNLYLVGVEPSGPAYTTLLRTDLRGKVAWKRSLADYWPVGGLTATDNGVLVAATLFDPNHREPASAVVLHVDAYGIERELWSLTGQSANDPGPDFIQPGPIAVDASRFYLGGFDTATPFYGTIVSRLRVQPRYWKLAGTRDVNGNGTAELAALRTLPDGSAEVFITDAVTKQGIRRLPFALAGGREIDVTGLLDMNGNGTAEVAVLFRKPNGQGVVQVRDGGTGAWITQMQFVGTAWDVKSLTELDLDGDGVSELGVLAQSDDLQSVGVQVRNSITKEQLVWMGMPVAYPSEAVRDVTAVEDVNADGTPEVAALYHDDFSAGLARIFVLDGASRQLISEGMSTEPSFPEPARKALGLTGIVGPAMGGEPGVAVLFDKPNGQGVAALARADSATFTNTMFFVGQDWAVRDIAALDLNSDGQSELAVLAEPDDGAASGVQIKDPLTGSQVQWIGLPTQ